MADNGSSQSNSGSGESLAEIEQRAIKRRDALLAELSEEQKCEMIEQVKLLREDYDKLIAEVEPGYFAYLRSVAGPYTDILIRDKEATLRSIHDADPAIREVALCLAESHWKLVDEITDQCEVLAQIDPSEAVRKVAIGVLGLSYSDTKDARIGRIIATVVRDEALSDKMRLAAYFALVVLDGRENHSVYPWKLSMSEVDWAFVDQYACNA
jgi:hypothetical protein